MAEALHLSRAEVHGVLSFYYDFRREPGGRHRLQICRAEACQAMGSGALEQHVRDALGIDFGETTEDGKFSLMRVECLGSCGTAPMFQLNDDYHEDLTQEKVDQLLDSLP